MTGVHKNCTQVADIACLFHIDHSGDCVIMVVMRQQGKRGNARMKAIAVINFTFSFLCLVVGLVSLLTTGTFWLSPWAFTLFATSFGMICLVVRNNSATIQELKELIRGTRGSLGNTEDQQFSLDDQAIEDGLIAPYRETPESEIVEYLDSGS